MQHTRNINTGLALAFILFLGVPGICLAEAAGSPQRAVRQQLTTLLLPHKKVTKTATRKLRKKLKRIKRKRRDFLTLPQATSGSYENEKQYSCTKGGAVTHLYNGDFDRIDGTLFFNHSGELILNECNGINGEFTLTSVLSVLNNNTISGDTSIGGTGSFDCTLEGITTPGNIDASINISFEKQVKSGGGSEATLNGNLNVSCEVNGQSLELAHCEWESVPLRDKEAIMSSCSFLF